MGGEVPGQRWVEPPLYAWFAAKAWPTDSPPTVSGALRKPVGCSGLPRVRAAQGRQGRLIESRPLPSSRCASGTDARPHDQLFMTRDAMLNAQTRKERDAVRDWLRAHQVPIEDASAQ